MDYKSNNERIKKSSDSIMRIKTSAAIRSNQIPTELVLGLLEAEFKKHPDSFEKHYTKDREDQNTLEGLSWQELLGKNKKGEDYSKKAFKNAFLRIGVHHKSEADYEQAKRDGTEFRDKQYCSVLTSTNGRTRFYKKPKTETDLERVQKYALPDNQQELQLNK